MQALREGPRKRRRMDAAKPQILSYLHSILNSAFAPASQSRFSEADPSPALWAAPVWPKRKALCWAG